MDLDMLCLFTADMSTITSDNYINLRKLRKHIYDIQIFFY